MAAKSTSFWFDGPCQLYSNSQSLCYVALAYSHAPPPLGYQRISDLPVFVVKNKWVDIHLNNRHCFRNLRKKYIFP